MEADLIIIHPKGESRGKILFLHGLGCKGENFELFFRELDWPWTIYMPTATVKPSSFVSEGNINSWFNIDFSK